MKKITLILVVMIVAAGLMADDWNMAADLSLTMNQNAYSDNWAGAAFKQYFDSNLDDNTNDGGVEFVAIYTKPFKENMIKYSTNLNLYKPIVYSESESLEGSEYEDDWKQVRMNWQHDVDISLTSLINLKLYIQLLYNEMVIDEIQFKETLGLGLSYKLF